MNDHKCEAMPDGVEVWAPRYQAEHAKGWRLYVDDGDNQTIIPIRFCPFCGEELGKEDEAERAARVAKAADIAKPDSNDPDDDPYDRPWED